MRYIGIDPGKSGGLAALGDAGEIIAVTKMPATNREIIKWFIDYAPSPQTGTRAALEFVRSTPQMGVSSSFTFGRGLGALEMALAAGGVPYYEVHPRRWQGVLGCLSKGNKNVTKALAEKIWPGQKVTHAIADALLIAEWCRRAHRHEGGNRAAIEQAVGNERVTR